MRFDTIHGPRWVWTTFSEGQVDFNFRNPEVLLQVMDSLVFYIRNGADILCLDAVTCIWAEPGIGLSTPGARKRSWKRLPTFLRR